MNDHLHDEEAIFHIARRLPPDQRVVYLKQVCGTDRALQVRVESLLALRRRMVQSSEGLPSRLDPLVDENRHTGTLLDGQWKAIGHQVAAVHDGGIVAVQACELVPRRRCQAAELQAG
jgi:hypothetical protein